jgi:hypothetical protein
VPSYEDVSLEFVSAELRRSKSEKPIKVPLRDLIREHGRDCRLQDMEHSTGDYGGGYNSWTVWCRRPGATAWERVHEDLTEDAATFWMVRSGRLACDFQIVPTPFDMNDPAARLAIDGRTAKRSTKFAQPA